MTLPTDSATPNEGVLQPDGLTTADDVEAIDDIEVIDVIEVVDAPAPEVPDRADAPVSEITERFLKVVLKHVPLERIEELHLFSPLRQGGVETGIAVIAARVQVVVAEQPAAPELPFEDVSTDVTAMDEAPVDEAPVEETPVEEAVDDAVEALEAEVLDKIAAADELVEADVLADAEDESVIETTPVPRIRHTVYTARYRLVQKGPERGKWEADVVAEAEAPLITVDLVVRGVQRRAGEESEIVRYSASQLARALRVPYPAV